MILALLSLLSVGAPQVPTIGTIPTAIAAAEVPTCLQFTPTHFVARSHADVEQWLVFESAGPGLLRVLPLAPHGEVLLPIVAGAAEDVSVEVVVRTRAGALVASGAIDCEVTAPRTLFLTRLADRLQGWAASGAEAPPSRFPTDRTSRASLAAERARRAAAAHVPVPAPAEHRKRDKSRPLERAKLPPV